MPKIRAATVPEHREAQRRAILVVARKLVLEGGVQALKFGDLAERAGIARSSIYDYFETKSDLLITLIREEAPSFREQVARDMGDADTPEAALANFVTAVLRNVAMGRHDLPFALAAGELDEAAAAAMAAAHRELFSLVIPILDDFGMREPQRALTFLAGVIASTAHTLSGRFDVKVVSQAATFCLGGVRALTGSGAATRRK